MIKLLLASLLVGLTLAAPLHHHHHRHHAMHLESDNCKAVITESIPQGLDVKTDLTTADSWIALINASKESIDITSFYWTLTGGDAKFGGDQGQNVYDALVAAAKRGVKIRIVQSVPTKSMPDDDTATLAKAGLVEVRNLNMTQYFGGGILHSKFWVFDSSSVWLGSANMDWRSLSQVKELGTQITDCPLLAADTRKLFEANWEAALETTLPKTWPAALSTSYDIATPAQVTLNSAPAEIYLASSPPAFCPQGRSSDVDAIVHNILTAEKTVSIEVMDYLPASAFMHPQIYWPVIDDAMRKAAFQNGVQVRMLIGNWTNSDPKMFPFLKSLNAASDGCAPGSIEVKLYNVPADPAGVVPYTRVNHAKFMVTDQVAYIGTSNWQAGYFINTGGASFNCKQPDFVESLQDVFDRDWNSEHSSPLP